MKIWINNNEFVEVGKNVATMLNEIATRQSAGTFHGLSRILPDPDPVLVKQGKDISVYRGLLTDAHVFSCVQSRKSGVLSLEWEIDRGKAKSRQARFVKDIFAGIDMYQLISEILDAPLFGFVPIEIVWQLAGGLAVPVKIQAKPQEWFQYDDENVLRLRKANTSSGLLGDKAGYFLPEYKFLVPRSNATYQNPYGEKVLSRVFWPVTFKKGGVKFWVVFAEKYGMPYLIGKHPRGITIEERDEIADHLENMIQDAIAVIPDDSQVELLESSGKSASADIFQRLLEAQNAEISKAILGQTLTTDVGSTGSYAASNTHFQVRQDIIAADKKLVEKTINQLIRWIMVLNFGDVRDVPVFSMWQEEDVDKTLAERDEILARTGVRFTKKYFRTNYGLEEDEFEISSPVQSPVFGEFAQTSQPRLPTDQAILDDLFDSISDERLQTQMEDALKPIFAAAQSGADFHELMEKSISAFPDMDTNRLEEFLQRVLFISQLWGRLNAEKA